MQWTREKDGVVQEAKGRWFSYKLSSNVKESREGKTEVLVGICSESEIPRDRKIAGIRNIPDVVLACGWQGDWMQRMNIIKEQRRAHSQSCPISICNQPQDPGQIEFCKVCLLINKLQITYTMNIVIDRELHACCLVYEKGPSNHLHHYKKIAHNAREISNGGWARNKLQTGIIFFCNFFSVSWHFILSYSVYQRVLPFLKFSFESCLPCCLEEIVFSSTSKSGKMYLY